MQVRRAVSLLAIDNSGPEPLFLSVSRRNDPSSLGLPGGKVDPGEDEVSAIVRETFEETGLKLSPEDLLPLYSGWCPPGPDGRFFWSTSFLLREGADLSGARSVEPGIDVAMTPLSIIGSPSDSFPEYNTALLEALETFRNHGFSAPMAIFSTKGGNPGP